jgi:hypothetical protein
MQYKYKHIYTKFLRSFARTPGLRYLLKANNLASPVRRSFNIGGCKLFARDGMPTKSFQPFDLANDLHRLVARSIQPEVVTSVSFQEVVARHLSIDPLMRPLNMLADGRDDPHLSLCEPGPIASQNILSRFFALHATEKKREFVWTRSRKRNVNRLLCNRGQP